MSIKNGGDTAGRADTNIGTGKSTTTGMGGANSTNQSANYSTPAAQAALLASDQKIATDLKIPLNQLTPQMISTYQQQEAARGGGFLDQVVMNKLVPMAAIGLATAGVGSGIGTALGGALGSTGGAIAGGAAQGALAGAGNAMFTGAPIGKGALTGALTGGVTGGINATGLPTTGETYLTDVYGVPQTLANAAVQGTVGAGVGALKGALTGSGAGRGALVGGLTGAGQGALNGAISSATDQAPINPYVNLLTGTASGILANNIAGKPAAPSVPAPPVPAAPVPAVAAAAPAKAQTQIAAPPVATPTPTPAPAGQPTTNIGSYGGLGYQPQSQVNPNIINYNTYGQGPEAHFFAPTPGT